MITEEDMFVNLIELFIELSPVEFIEEYNRAFGTDFTVDDVDWKAAQTNGEKIQYQIW